MRKWSLKRRLPRAIKAAERRQAQQAAAEAAALETEGTVANIQTIFADVVGMAWDKMERPRGASEDENKPSEEEDLKNGVKGRANDSEGSGEREDVAACRSKCSRHLPLAR